MGKRIKEKSFLISGIPIKSGIKIILTILFLIGAFLSYVFLGEIVAVAFLFLALVFSIGSKLSEAFVIGTAIFMILNAIYDFIASSSFVGTKMQIFISMGILLVLELSVGRISILNAWRIFQKSMGVK